MRLVEPLVSGRLLRRYKRFLMDLELADGSVLTVHCPNTGSMEGCLATGAEVLASRASNPRRKLTHTAEWIRLPSGWVGINTHRANRIAQEALVHGRVPEFAAYTVVKAEVFYPGRSKAGQSRADFLLTADDLPDCYVEVKNTTWSTADGGVGFPDAVTARGLKHIGDLRRMVRRGHRAALLFVVNRQDGSFFRPAAERDPAYDRALVRGAAAGVELLAYRVCIDPPEATLGDRLPIRLDAVSGS